MPEASLALWVLTDGVPAVPAQPPLLRAGDARQLPGLCPARPGPSSRWHFSIAARRAAAGTGTSARPPGAVTAAGTGELLLQRLRGLRGHTLTNTKRASELEYPASALGGETKPNHIHIIHGQPLKIGEKQQSATRYWLQWETVAVWKKPELEFLNNLKAMEIFSHQG